MQIEKNILIIKLCIKYENNINLILKLFIKVID